MPDRCSVLRPFALSVLVAALAARADAATVVIANHTTAPVAVEVGSAGAKLSQMIAPGDSIPFFSGTPLTATYGAGLNRKSEALAADAIYRFVSHTLGGHTGVELRRIGLTGEVMGAPNPAAWRTGAGPSDAPVKVIVCVDDDEPMREAQWQSRLTQRLKKASEIVERQSGVKFVPVGFQTWQSNNAVTDFTQSFREFENTITPPEDAIAIGFTSQYSLQLGRQHMGGTRGPLRRHVMLREWSPRISEAERIELLVHELGHYLGAGHSPEAASVMRPVLGDRPVRLRSEVVRFDPVNTLAIAMVGEEVRRRGVRDLAGITQSRRNRLQQVYTTLSSLTPGEPAGVALLRRLAQVGGDGKAEDSGAVTSDDRSEAAAAAVIEAVTRAAASNQKRDFDARLKGDELTDELVRAAAGAADDPKGFVIGVGIAIDNSGALRMNPRTRAAVEGIEPDRQRRQRLNLLGKPTARGREDLVKHFFVSAAMTALLGEKEAYLWGFGKELADATREGGSGFSFADLAADRAGVRFAKGVLAGNPPTAGLATSFRIDNYLPAIDGLPEGLPLNDVVKTYGGQGDPRFNAQIEEIDRRIEALPAYSLMRLGLP
ncbi:M12 family metallo-peptidase [Botrimarina mediterranea]|uniref:Matrixin n=1 Tax=Botrimarina mediterranea TaxID=2528022 RepID=A0A518KA12_9BACT|nr:M12 family metallo-peptidase [Botrimarina mediterranea]QDV74637.1 hypothetical protein Spa11_28430 [Botrimarina mediterranea]